VLPRGRTHPGLFLEFAPGGEIRVLHGARGVAIEGAGRDLQQDATRGQTELADEQETILVVEGEDGDRSRMTGDVAFRARAVRALDSVDAEGQVATLVDDARPDDAFDEVGPGVVLRGR
jgi:hypothetical protein